MNLERRLACRDRLANLEHVRAKNLMFFRCQMIGVVFHERGAARQSLAHDLHGAYQGRGLPVALGAESVTLGHQSLRPKTRKLPQSMQVFERRREALEAASPQKGAQP